MGSLSEHHPSLWVTTAGGSRFPPLTDDLAADVVVVGGGITGLLTAWACQRDGAEVVLVDAGPLAAGATGYTTAKVSSLHGMVYRELTERIGPEGACRYAEANQAGLALIASLVDDLDIDCDFSRRPAFDFSEEPGSVDDLRAEAEAAAGAGLPAVFTTETDLPWPVAGAVRVEDQGQFDPRRFCLGIADALVARGGRIFEDTRALGLEHGSGRPTVRTTGGTITAAHVVIASHMPFPDHGLYSARCSAQRSYCLAVTVNGPIPTGMYLGTGQVTRSIRAACGDTVLIVGGEGHEVGHDADTTRRYRALECWARDRFDVVSVDHRWSAQDYVTADGVPYVGRLRPGADASVLVATGFRKWGMTGGAAAALMLADQMAGRANDWARLFDSTRLDVARSARGLVSFNADTGVRFVKDRAAALTARHAGELRRGEGAVVHSGGRIVAAHRDDDGRLHTVSPRCTHLGCWVTWNTAERSWDCPCHGSRFGPDGRVLEGPATTDLPPRG